jgi:hypothetical protein
MQHIGTFLHNEMGISMGGISPMCGRSSIQLQKIFFLRSIAGEAVETLKRDQRAAIDALRLEVEVLKRCLCQVHPELAAQFEAIRATLIREFDPEAS